MPVDLINCDRPLTVLIETEAERGNVPGIVTWQQYFFDFIDDYSLTLSNTPHSHNTSYAWEITDHIKRNKDVLVLNGTIGCISCGNRNSTFFNSVEEELKYFKERMLYNRATMARITMPDFLFTNAVLVNATVRNTHNKSQRKSVSITFQGYNFTGLIQKPSSISGGVDNARIRGLSTTDILV